VATRYDKQITVDALSRFLPERWRAVLRVVTDLFTAGVTGVVAWHAGRLVLDDRAAGSMVFGSVPVWVCELILPVAFGVIAVRYAAYAVRHCRLAVGGEANP
jgi:TRAP-type C4-dicarboxylate transport system permease small subunit